MKIVPESFIETLKRRDFLVLILVTIIGQIASAFLILALIVSVFLKTNSNFGVSGVILSFASPGLLMAFAGLLADLFDRRKIILISNFFLCVVMVLLVFAFRNIYVAISLSFLYFSGNAFFVPAATAASAQLVKKTQLLSSNSLFVFCLAGGQLLGFMFAALVHFFFGTFATLLVCLVLSVVAAVLSFFLPEMLPREKKNVSILGTIIRIWRAFAFIFSRKRTWFFFVMLALMQGIIAFGVTLAPGFFKEVLHVPVEKSLVIVFPMIGLGALLGAFFVHNPDIRESRFLSIGIASIGVPGLIVGFLIYFGLISPTFILALVCLYLTLMGFGVIVSMIASRTVLQKSIAHNYLGSVFGANTILAAFFAGSLSPFAAGAEALLGYIKLMILAGVVFSAGAILLFVGGNRWKF